MGYRQENNSQNTLFEWTKMIHPSNPESLYLPSLSYSYTSTLDRILPTSNWIWDCRILNPGQKSPIPSTTKATLGSRTHSVPCCPYVTSNTPTATSTATSTTKITIPPSAAAMSSPKMNQCRRLHQYLRRRNRSMVSNIFVVGTAVE
jgi:hypothetical protein